MRMSSSWKFLLPILAFTAVGCGSNDQGPTGTVTGKVTMGKRTVAAGQVNIYSEDLKKSGAGVINADGTYSVAAAPVGKGKVTVSVPRPPARGTANLMNKDKATASPAPERYRNPATSDIAVEVATGSQTFDIQLKGK